MFAGFKGGESKARKRLKRALMRVVAIVAMRGITNVFDQSKGTVSKWKKVKDRFDVQSGLGAKYHTKQKVNRAAFRTTDVGLLRPRTGPHACACRACRGRHRSRPPAARCPGLSSSAPSNSSAIR